MIPSPPQPQCLISGKEFHVSKCAGELVPGDRNGAWLHDNEIVSAWSYVCACPGGRREGMLGWEDHGWRLLLPWKSGSGVLGGMHKQPSRINALWKQSFGGACELKPGRRWGSCCCFAPSPSCLTGRCAQGDGPGREGQVFPSPRGILAAWVLLISSLEQERSRCQPDLELLHRT